MNSKNYYTGLQTQRQQVECQPLMKASSAKLKVKTEYGTSTEDWKTGDTGDALKTSITTSFGE